MSRIWILSLTINKYFVWWKETMVKLRLFKNRELNWSNLQVCCSVMFLCISILYLLFFSTTIHIPDVIILEEIDSEQIDKFYWHDYKLFASNNPSKPICRHRWQRRKIKWATPWLTWAHINFQMIRRSPIYFLQCNLDLQCQKPREIDVSSSHI